MEAVEARHRADQKIEELKTAFSGTLSEPFELLLVGALQTGLYIGPKRAIFSANPSCPFPEIVEADLRIILSKGHPHDDAIIERIAKAAKAESYIKKEAVHWDKTDVPMTSLYWYEEISQNLGFEFELCINREPYVEIAPFWSELFSEKEIEWQKNLRRLVTSIDVPETDYIFFKQRQTTEARWRLVAAMAMDFLEATGKLSYSHDRPKPGAPRPPVDVLVNKWLQGESGYRTMERPDIFLPENIKASLEKFHEAALVSGTAMRPPSPDWVSYAEQIQNSLKTNRQIKFSPDFR